MPAPMTNTVTLPLVSVLIPSYNHVAYVRAAVESVLGQTCSELELIVIDDASEDGSWGVLQSFTDNRIRLERHEVNLGAHATLNEAMGMAKGDYIAILNSDDVYHPERLEVMVSHLQARPDLAAAFSHYSFIDAAGLIVRDSVALAAEFPDPRATLGDFVQTMDEREIRVLSLLARNYLHSTSNLVLRRSVYEEIGGFSNYRYVHDHDFFLRLCQAYRVGLVEQGLLEYRFHGSNTLAESEAASVMETGVMLMNFMMNSQLGGLRDTSAPEFQAVFAYLLESLTAYGAEMFMLILALTESNGCYKKMDIRENYPAIFNCQRITNLIGKSIVAARKEDALAWQSKQTTQWWETAQLHSAKIMELEVHNVNITMALSLESESHQRVAHQLFLAEQEISQAKQETGQIRQNLQNLEWEYSSLLVRYQRTWSFRVRKLARRLLGIFLEN